MSNLTMASPPIATFAAAYTSAGTGQANLVSRDPKEVFIASGAGAVQVALDFGVAISLSQFFLGFTNLVAGATADVYVGATASTLAGSMTLAATSTGATRRHMLLTLAAAVTTRYAKVIVTPGTATPLQAGVLLAADAFRPARPQEFGSGRPIIDTGAKQRLISGGFGILEGVRKAGWQWVLGDLTNDEREQLFALALDAGETRRALVVEDPDATAGLHERIHYGLFDRLEPYTRQDTNLNRWASGSSNGCDRLAADRKLRSRARAWGLHRP